MSMIDFTTAPREEIRKVYDAIAAELGDDRFFTTKELDVLPKILSPREQVLSFSSGLMEGGTWLIVLTDARVLFLDKGMIFGLKQTSIELTNIVSIQGETGLMFGTIKMGAANGTYEIRNVWKRTVNPFVNSVRAAMAARQRGEQLLSPGTGATAPTPSPVPYEPAPIQSPAPSPAAAPAQPQPQGGDVIAQIERLDRLRRSGAITDADYQSMKSRIV